METPKTPPPQNAPESRLHFLDYWRIIRIRKTVILLVFLIVVLTTIGITFVLEPTYMSTATIEVGKDSTDIAPLLMGGQVAPGYDPYFIETQFKKIRSSKVLNGVVTNLHLDQLYAERAGRPNEPLIVDDAAKILDKQIDLRTVRNTALIEIRVYDKKAETARDIASQIYNYYKAFREENDRNASQESIKILQGWQSRAQTNLNIAMMDLDELRTSNRITDIDVGPGAFQQLESEVVRHYEQLREQNEELFVRYSKLLTNLLVLQTESKQKLREALPTAFPDPLLGNLMENLNQARKDLAFRQADYGPNNPALSNAVAMISELNSRIDERVEGILTGLAISVKTYEGQLKDAMENLQQAKEEERRKLALARPYMTAKGKVESMSQILRAIEVRTQQESVDQSLPKSSRVQLTEPAKLIRDPVRPQVALNIALGVIVGLIMGFGLAFFIEYLDTSVKTIDDVEKSLQAPVLGVIPQNVGSILEEGADSPHAEAYRVLRTNLLFSRKDSNWNTLTVVSGGAGEGKSTTIFNLAAIFAQNGARVLVVDSDLRRPSLHKILNVSNSVGLTNILLKQNSLEEAVQTTPQPSLHFLPSGKLPSSSLGILNSIQMREFVQMVKQKYDFVFFDSPPIMGVSDASVLASVVDMAILVIQYRKYPQAMTVRAKQTVEKVGGHLLGVVLNNINISQDSYYYYYSGYYYDYYSKQDESAEPKKNGESKSPATARGGIEIKPKY